MGSIHVEELGAGGAVLFIHGLGSGGSHFAQVAERLAARRRCLLVDLPGHGKSKPASGGPPAFYAAALRDLVRHEQRLDVVGLSFGAFVTLELWHLMPEHIGNVILLDPPLSSAPMVQWARSRAGSSGTRQLLLSLYTERDRARLVEMMRVYPLTSDLAEQSLHENATLHLAADPQATFETLHHLESYEIRRERAPHSTSAVTIVRATNGHVCPSGAAQELARALRADLVCVESGHCMGLSNPLGVTRAIEKALRQNPPRSPRTILNQDL